jgi:hypothetical protein
MAGPEEIAARILKCDRSLEWVTVMTTKGDSLAHVQSPNFLPGPKTDDGTVARLGALDSVTLGAFRRAEAWYGSLDYAVVAHQLGQIILIRDAKRKMLFAVKTQRSQNPEYLFTRIKAALKGGS